MMKENNIAQPGNGGVKSFAGISTPVSNRVVPSVIELRDSQAARLNDSIEIDPTFNMRHSNSEGLPDIDSQNPAKAILSSKD